MTFTNEHKPLFITGTDTDVGKTVVSAWLVHQFNMDYWKPIQCGDLNNTDTMKVARLSGFSTTRSNFCIHPEAYSFAQTVSPHLAARQSKLTIDLQQIRLPVTQNRLVIEGAGGVWVPVNPQQNMMDLIKHLDARVIVVSRGTLGTINHTCLTLEALRSRGIDVLGVIISGAVQHENKQAIEHFGKTRVLAELPLIETLDCASLSACKATRLLQEKLLEDKVYT